MAESTAPDPEVIEANTTDAAVDIIVENPEANGESNQKRDREDEEEDGVSKKQKVEAEEDEKKSSGSDPVKLGPKSFCSSLEMFDYFYKLLHAWPPYLNVNKYEQIMLLELLKNGHTEPDKKIGGGIRAFQVRRHSMWKSRCFFLIREDESVDDFSFRKCVDHILPLPEEMQLKPDVNKAFGGSGGAKHHGGRGGSGRGGGRGHGRKGMSRR
ncbi:protein EMBRYO DEFECTIVE 514-like [Gastrolobium bilobum]|uniref:protein EMBRYO DEFECTIVE 514-like n=1 Tax=Gastrolobium bilobum TaxID=150636 RepID=UPI002AB148EA|nr:protein EMBRYO DEFECTIVE 514-like [Gastrolobium bilobum]